MAGAATTIAMRLAITEAEVEAESEAEEEEEAKGISCFRNEKWPGKVNGVGLRGNEPSYEGD